MPYKIHKRSDTKKPYKIVDERGHVKGSSKTKKDAKASIRIINAREHGYSKPPRKKK